MTSPFKNVEQSFVLAKERYAAFGVDVDRALQRLGSIPISLHCWQGDDIGGFENTGSELGGGLAVTGNYPGRARTPDELRADVDKALALIPGTHRFNLHASYAETGEKKSSATSSSRRTSSGGSTGPRRRAWEWTSTPPTSPTPERLTA